MAMEITGKVLQIMQAVTGEGKNGSWKKQEFVIETLDQYPKKVILQVWGDKVSVLQSLKPGTEVKASFNPESREYNGRWYTDLRAWRVDVTGGSSSSSDNAYPVSAPQDFDAPSVPPVEFKDDLPF